MDTELEVLEILQKNNLLEFKSSINIKNSNGFVWFPCPPEIIDLLEPLLERYGFEHRELSREGVHIRYLILITTGCPERIDIFNLDIKH